MRMQLVWKLMNIIGYAQGAILHLYNAIVIILVSAG